jgi:tetratricopeptide (TPR) repeat protein
LAQFAANLGLPPTDLRRRFVYFIHGDGGVGKTLLVRQLETIARERGAVSAYVDESAFGVPDALAEIAAHVAAQGVRMKNFLHLAENYRQRRHEVEADPQAPAGIATLMTRTATRAGVEALRSVPGIGALAAVVDSDALADQADQLRRFLGAKLRHEDVQMLLSPVDVLSPVFVREIAEGVQGRPLVLFIDTYERTGLFLDGWLLAVLEGRYGQLPADTVLAIAGRDPLDRGRWSPYLSVLADMPLSPFGEAESRQLLSSRGITDEKVVRVILQISGGLPLLLAMLAEHQPADAAAVGDPTGDAVERFLKWEANPVKRALALTAALPRTVNEDVLRVLISDNNDARQEFAWLRSLSFVARQSGRCQYHPVVRAAMLRLEHNVSPSRWTATHRRLASYYRSTRTARSTAEAWDDASWRELLLEETYHELCAGSVRAVPNALGAVINALNLGLDVASAWIQAIGQAGEDASSEPLLGWGVRLAQAHADAEFKATAILDLMLREADLETPTKVQAYRLRGREYRRHGKYEDALADYSRALEIDHRDHRAAWGRGETHRLMCQHDEALEDFTRAIALAPEVAWAIASRGQEYWEMGRYQDALADFSRALEIDPGDAWTVAFRGQTHRALGRHDEALADLSRAIELEPAAWTRFGRGETYRLMGRYQEALDDLDRAVELGPDSPWVRISRGETYRLMGRHDEALADFVRAAELKPGFAWEKAAPERPVSPA